MRKSSIRPGKEHGGDLIIDGRSGSINWRYSGACLGHEKGVASPKERRVGTDVKGEASRWRKFKHRNWSIKIARLEGRGQISDLDHVKGRCRQSVRSGLRRGLAMDMAWIVEHRGKVEVDED